MVCQMKYKNLLFIMAMISKYMVHRMLKHIRVANILYLFM